MPKNSHLPISSLLNKNDHNTVEKTLFRVFNEDGCILLPSSIFSSPEQREEKFLNEIVWDYVQCRIAPPGEKFKFSHIIRAIEIKEQCFLSSPPALSMFCCKIPYFVCTNIVYVQLKFFGFAGKLQSKKLIRASFDTTHLPSLLDNLMRSKELCAILQTN